MIDRFSGDHAFLSNFHPSEVEYDGVMYPTVEHAYQAAKTLDESWRKKILECKTPGQAKRMGMTVPLRDDWTVGIRLIIMRYLLTQKFMHEDLKNSLLATGDRELIEGNNWGDMFWGICEGVGENHLGKLLETIRLENQCRGFVKKLFFTK